MNKLSTTIKLTVLGIALLVTISIASTYFLLMGPINNSAITDNQNFKCTKIALKQDKPEQFVMMGGTSITETKAESIIANYWKSSGVQGDIEGNMKLTDQTSKDFWEDYHMQIFVAKLDYNWRYETVLFKDGSVVASINGVAPYIADLDGDCHYEIYSQYSMGSGIVSQHIAGYNPQTKEVYELGDRMKRDFYIELTDGIMYAQIHNYMEAGTSLKAKLQLVSENGRKVLVAE